MTEVPLVAVLSRAPLLVEGLHDAFAGVADVRGFVVRVGETGGLLESIRPDAVVVGGDADVDDVAAYAARTGAAAVLVGLRDGGMTVFRDGGWERHDGDASPAAIRNAFLGSLRARSGLEAPR